MGSSIQCIFYYYNESDITWDTWDQTDIVYDPVWDEIVDADKILISSCNK